MINHTSSISDSYLINNELLVLHRFTVPYKHSIRTKVNMETLLCAQSRSYNLYELSPDISPIYLMQRKFGKNSDEFDIVLIGYASKLRVWSDFKGDIIPIPVITTYPAHIYKVNYDEDVHKLVCEYHVVMRDTLHTVRYLLNEVTGDLWVTQFGSSAVSFLPYARNNWVLLGNSKSMVKQFVSHIAPKLNGIKSYQDIRLATLEYESLHREPEAQEEQAEVTQQEDTPESYVTITEDGEVRTNPIRVSRSYARWY